MHRNIFKNVNSNFWKRFLYFGRNSGVHGLNHVFRRDTKLLIRFFWVTVLLISTGCLYLLLEPVVERDGEVNYTPDTRYLRWNTIFPAVTVCEKYIGKSAQKKFSELYPDLMEPLNYDFRRYLTDVLFARGACKKSVCIPCGKEIPCDLSWRKIIDAVHKKCDEIITECNYDGKSFPCCKNFHIVDSEYGPCYSFNTLQHANYDIESLRQSNITTGPGVLSFRLLTEAKVSVHSTEELSTNNLDNKLKFDVQPHSENRVEFLFSLVEIENDPMLQFEYITSRGCRYLHEIPNERMHTYPVYSYGACRLAENTEDLYHHCGCVHPVRDLSLVNKYCNYTGINCLVTNEVQRNKLGIDKHVDEDFCLPSCMESELKVIHISRRWTPNELGAGTVVTVRMAFLPNLRYQRNLIRTDLDLVVSVGGMVGLFFSASILSLVEIFYLLLRKPAN